MCFVPDCKHYSERDTCRFFTFPKEKNKAKKWITAIRFVYTNTRVKIKKI